MATPVVGGLMGETPIHHSVIEQICPSVCNTTIWILFWERHGRYVLPKQPLCISLFGHAIQPRSSDGIIEDLTKLSYSSMAW
jgi:hypothetical protein